MKAAWHALGRTSPVERERDLHCLAPSAGETPVVSLQQSVRHKVSVYRAHSSHSGPSIDTVELSPPVPAGQQKCCRIPPRLDMTSGSYPYAQRSDTNFSESLLF